LAAGGVVGSEIKSYLFAQDASEALFLIEIVVQLATRTVKVQAKSNAPASLSSAFVNYLQQSLADSFS